jgi:hypothetical protein
MGFLLFKESLHGFDEQSKNFLISLLSKVLNDADTSLMFRAGRSDGNRESILIDIPAAKVSGTSPIDAKNQDRMFTGTYAAKMHATLGYTIAAQRYWYLPVAV